MSNGIALDEDYHVHSTFSDDGASTLDENVRAARRRGLRTLCCADHVRAGVTWVPGFVAAVSEYRSTPGLRVLAGVEAKILDTAGKLDVPADLGAGVDLILIADHQFPGEGGPVHPDRMRSAIEEGETTAAAAIECLATAIMRAFGSVGRSLLVHPFSLLPKMALREEQVPDALLTDVAMAARRAGAMVEINEKWRCPQPRTVAIMARAGVRLVAGSDSHHCRDVGVYNSVRDTVRASLVSGTTTPDPPSG
jgi:putative hydrolase